MNGFIVTLSFDGSPLPETYTWKPLFDFQQEHRSSAYQQAGLFIEQFTPDKFHEHKFFEENSEGFLATEGLVTNILSLYESEGCSTAGTLIRKLLMTGPTSLNKLHGNFAGVYYEKSSKQLTIFNNQTGTQKIFYYRDEHYFAASTDLWVLTTTLRNLGIQLTPDCDAIQMLLSYGFMLKDFSLVKQIRQLTAGQLLTINTHETKLTSYFHLKEIKIRDGQRKELIDQLESMFQQAVHEEYMLDQHYGYQSVATMSGGLDSRMTALAAHEAGYKQQLLNFSQKGYADEKIARQIARHYHFDLQSIHLSAESLLDIDEVIRVNDGLTMYSGASHVLHALRRVQFNHRGVLHTGMLGDAIMGSYLSAPCAVPAKSSSGAYAPIEGGLSGELFNSLAAGYPSEELFKFYNRAFQGINNGYQYLYLFSESLSPFMHPGFLQLALSIPREFMYKEKLYIEWMKSRHPKRASFCWENIGGRPTNSTLLRSLYRIKRAVVKRLPVESMWKNSMTPEQYWYDNSETVRTTLDAYFHKQLNQSIITELLRQQLRQLYEQHDFTRKAQVLTVLSALKHLFP